MKKIIISAAVIVLAACSTKKATTTAAVAPVPPGSADVVALGAKTFPGYTQADYNGGKALYEGNCGTCHGLKKPSSRDEKEWRHEVADMAPKANRKAGSQVIGAPEQELIVRYLVSAGSFAKGAR